MKSPYAALVMWALGARDSARTSPAARALSKAQTPELVARAVVDPAVLRRLGADVRAERREGLVRGLAVVFRHGHLRHDSRVPVGAALVHLSDSARAALPVVVGLSGENTARVLSNALGQVARHTGADLIELVTLLADWDELDVRERSELLVDLHTAHRA